MDTAIYNIDDLRIEILRLRASKKEQEIVLKAHFKSPAAIFHTVTSLFKGNSTTTDVKPSHMVGSLLGNQDVISLLSRVVLPFVLNKTIFRRSNFIIKAAIGLLSQKASGYINEKSVTTIWDKIKALLPKKKSPKRLPSEYEADLLIQRNRLL